MIKFNNSLKTKSGVTAITIAVANGVYWALKSQGIDIPLDVLISIISVLGAGAIAFIRHAILKNNNVK